MWCFIKKDNFSIKMWYLILALVIVFAIWFYRYITRNYDYFKDRNIPYEKAVFMLGSNPTVMLKKESMPEWIRNMYMRFKDEK